MLRSLREILGYKIEARDGLSGRAKDFLFDDQSWGTRYLVAGTGEWLLYRQVLIPPQAVREPVWGSSIIPVALTKEEVEGSPGIESHPPVTRRYDRLLTAYYSWEAFWPTPSPLAVQGIMTPAPVVTPTEEEAEPRPAADPHLQSVRDVAGYRIQAADGEAGRLADLLVQTDGWGIRYLVVDTRRRVGGRRVLLSPAWVTAIDWQERLLHVSLEREEIHGSVEFDPSAPVNRQSEVRLYDYYGRPRDREAPGDLAGRWYREGRRIATKHRAGRHAA